MTKEKFYHGLTEISDKYIKEADIFGPVKPEKVSPLSTVLRWGCAAAACLVVGIGVWLLGKNGLLPIASVQSQPGGASSLSSAVNGTEVLSENTVTMNRDGSLTFANPEFQEVQRVFLRHEPVVVGEMREEQGMPVLEASDGTKYALPETGDPVDRILTLTLPLFVAGRYEAADRTNLLWQLLETDYYFCKPEDGSPAYLKSSPRFDGLAGVIGYYDEEHVYHAEQPRYAEEDNYADLLREFQGAEPGSGSTLGVSGESAGNSADSASLPPESPRDLEGPYEKWERYGGEDLIYKLLYSYLEQNDLLEYARVQLPGSKEMVELSGGDSIADGKSQQSDVPLLSRDALYISKEGDLYFANSKYQKLYFAFEADSRNVKTGEDAVSEAGDDSCTMVLDLILPYYMIGRYPVDDETSHLLCLLEEQQYGFFEKDGEKTVRPIGGYSDIAGMTAVKDAGDAFAPGREPAWYPGDGKRYVSSIAEFTGLTEEETSALLEKAEQKRSAFNKDGEQAGGIAQQLLFAYMSQNDLTGYLLQDGEHRPITDEELHAAAMRNETAKQNVYLDKEQKAAQDEMNTAGSYTPTITKETAKALVNEYRMQEFVNRETYPLASQLLVDYSYIVLENDPDNNIRLTCRIAFQLQDPDDSEARAYWVTENTEEGTEAYEGYWVTTRNVYAKWVYPPSEPTEGKWVFTGSEELAQSGEVPYWEEVRRVAKQQAQNYVNQRLSDTEHPLTECFYQNLRVEAISEEKGYFRMAMQLVFKPENEESLSYWWAGNTKPGTGENEGYYTAMRHIEVEKIDGVWTITDSGTGGFTNEGGVEAVDWTIE